MLRGEPWHELTCNRRSMYKTCRLFCLELGFSTGWFGATNLNYCTATLPFSVVAFLWWVPHEVYAREVYAHEVYAYKVCA
jgi:hypothetical protein